MKTELKKKQSTLKQHYWDNDGVYQKEYDELWESLVPKSDNAPTIHGELLRSVGRLYHDYCNNGNCNAMEFETESCSECYGSGYEEEECYYCNGTGVSVDENEDDEQDEVKCYECEGEGEVTKDCHWCGGECEVRGELVFENYYKDMVDFLDAYMDNTEPLEKLVNFLTENTHLYYSYEYTDKEMAMYDKVVDAVIFQILTTENEENPYYKPAKEEA